jgi:FAD/FMN-containing dehydrogenase
MSAVGEQTIPGFTGRVVAPDDADYNGARAVWNVIHDRRPALVAGCASPADVAAAIAYAGEHSLRVAVRGGGHSLPGFSTVDGGIVLDLRPLNHVIVDAASRRIRVGGGALLGDVDRGAQAHGLVVPAGVVSHTGVGGLTLGGGVGRLFWALRGGGGNFGVVTEFEFRAHELTVLPILATFHPLERASDVLAVGERMMSAPGTPKELLWTSFMRRGPAEAPWMTDALEGTPGVMSMIEWSGEVDEGLELLREIERELEPPAGELATVPYLTIQSITDELLAPGTLHAYLKAGFAAEITDAMIESLIDRGASVGSRLSVIEVLSLGGAIRDVPNDATAFPHREARWLINIAGQWRDPAATDDEIAWARGTFAALEPHLGGGAYSNFMGDDDARAASVAYGSTLARLSEIKAKYDPDNVFRLNQNIEPAR